MSSVKKNLEELIKDRLDTCISAVNINSNESKRAFSESMNAIKQLNEINRLELERQSKKESLKLEGKKVDTNNELEMSKLSSYNELEMNKLSNIKDENQNSRNFEEKKFEVETKNKHKERLIRVLEIAAIPIATLTIQAVIDNHFMNKSMKFEEDGKLITSESGKSLMRSIFRFKR